VYSFAANMAKGIMKTTLSSFTMNYLFLLLCLLPVILSAQVREYQLTIDYGRVEVAGAEGMGMLVNKQYPGPTLYFTEGDTAKITVINNMEVNSSIHWHGLLVPYDQDGVPYLSNLPIPPKGTYVYEFPIKHHGTYWYHSHVGLQEQQGVHGAIVIEAKQARFPNMKEAVLVLQDWTRENPDKVLANLKKDGDYYAMKKDAVVHLWGYWKNKALANWWQSQ